MKNDFLKSELVFYIWQCHGKWVEKYFIVLNFFKFIKKMEIKSNRWKS